jgi:hypothetical protein
MIGLDDFKVDGQDKLAEKAGRKRSLLKSVNQEILLRLMIKN